MKTAAGPDISPGQIARIRQRTYLIEEVLKPKRVADSTLARLSCVDDDNQGQPPDSLYATNAKRVLFQHYRPKPDKTAPGGRQLSVGESGHSKM